MKHLYEELLSDQVTDCQIDSRKIKKNSLFFALNGEKNNGHEFLRQVADNKAFGAVIKKGYINEKLDLRLFEVDDVLGVMQDLAREKFMKSYAKVIGITGSCGKTTTKEFLATLLDKKFRVGKSMSNHNSQRGLPISVLNMKQDVEVIIQEMGMDLPGEIEKLVDILPPDIAIITKLYTYYQAFEKIEDVAIAKAEILSNKRTKLAVLNYELLEFDVFQCDKILSYSLKNKKADFFLDQNYLYEYGKKIKIQLPFSETHLKENFLAAYVVAREFMEVEEILDQIDKLKSYNMRFEKVIKNKVLFIKDCYNANPLTMKVALENLPKVNKTIAVLGAMEGIDKKDHEKIAKLAIEKTNIVLCIGDSWKGIDGIKLFDDKKSLTKHLKNLLEEEDVVLIKGSRSYQMEEIFNLL